MTTVIGINGYDPIRKKEYILLGSDSMWNNKETKEVGYNARKIIHNQNGNLIFGYAGTALLSPINTFHPKSEEAIDKINQFLFEKEKIFEKNIKKINAKNSFIYGFNTKEGLTLNNTHDNCFNFLGYSQRYKFSKEKNLFYSMIGSGGNAAYKKIKENLDSAEIDEEKGRIINFKDALINIHQGLIESTKEDEHTGGHMDIGVLTNEGYGVLRKFTNLDEEENFYEMRERNVEKIKKEVKTTRKSLDKILLKI